MSSYAYTANSTSQQTVALATDKVRISTTSPIQVATGSHNTVGTGNITTNIISVGTGNITSSLGSKTVTGVATTFRSPLLDGYWIGNVGGTTIGRVSHAPNNTNMILTENASLAVTNEEFTYSSNLVVTGVGTSFTTQLTTGDWIGDITGNTVGVVDVIANNTSLTLLMIAENTLGNVGFTFNSTGVQGAYVTANSEMIEGNSIDNSFIVGQGNSIAFKNVSGTASVFSITELGMPHADTGTSGS